MLLPKICLPLFPVVDRKRFRRNFSDNDAYRSMNRCRLDGPRRHSTDPVSPYPPRGSATWDAGFVVISLEAVYRNHDIASVRLAKWDNHPNSFGHRLVCRDCAMAR